MAILIKQVYEFDPLNCPECGGRMNVVSTIEPPHADVIGSILKHYGFRQFRSERGPPRVNEWVFMPTADRYAELARKL